MAIWSFSHESVLSREEFTYGLNVFALFICTSLNDVKGCVTPRARSPGD